MPGGGRGWLARAAAWIPALAGVVCLGLLVRWADPQATWEVLRRARPGGTVSVLGLCALILGLQTAGWHVLLRSRGWRAGFGATARSMLMGNAVAWATPSMYLGGEPVRIWHMARVTAAGKAEVAATVVAHKFCEFAGFIVALLVCTGTMLQRFDLDPRVRWGSLAASGILLAAFVVLAVAFSGRWPLLSGVLRRFGPRAERLRGRAEALEAGIEETFRSRRGAFVACLALTGGPAVLIVLKPLLFFAAIGRPLSFPELALLFVCTQILLAFQLTPGGIGLFEGGVVGAFALIGVGGPEALAFAAAQRASDALLVGAGFLLLSVEGAWGFFRGDRAEGG